VPVVYRLIKREYHPRVLHPRLRVGMSEEALGAAGVQ